jgi:mono/diheme cytochrome c family protein
MNRTQVLTLTSTGVLAAFLGAAGVGLARDPGQRTIEFLPDMVESVPYDAFSENPVFADGRTLRDPVSGTVARGFPPLHYGTTPEDAARAGVELADPLPASDAGALARGAKVFERFCAECHGPDGKGDGPVARRGFPPPPALSSARVRGLKAGQLFHIVTFGQGNMPSYAGQVPRDDRWKVVRFVEGLARKEAP